ncbi:MAG: chorismate mutase, partial [Nitrospinota bacterium]
MTERLKKLRSEIDGLDRQIISLLNQRAAVAIDVGKEKSQSNMSIHCPDRERMLLQKLGGLNKGPFSNEAIVKIYREIMSCTLALEEPLKVSFLGPEGTFSHLAALKKFGSSVVAVPVGGIDEVFNKAEKG